MVRGYAPRMSIRAVIFDIGGVLEMTPATGWENRWCEKLGLTRHQFEARLEPFFMTGANGRAGLPEIESQIRQALGLGETELARLMADIWHEYLGTLNEELVNYFRGLRPRYRTAMLSNSFVGAREREEARYGLGRMCDLIVYSHEEGLLKPDPQIYRIACERLAIPAEDCVFLDDVPTNVEGAWSIGMHAVAFENDEQAIQKLEDCYAAPADHYRLDRRAAVETSPAHHWAPVGVPDGATGAGRR